VCGREREGGGGGGGDQKGDFLNVDLGSSSSFDLQRLWPIQGTPSCEKASQRPKPTSTLKPACFPASPSQYSWRTLEVSWDITERCILQ